MPGIINLEEMAALGFLGADLPEDASVHRRRVREARKKVRSIRREFELSRSEINEGGLLSDTGVADALRRLAESKLMELDKLGVLADQTATELERSVAGEPPTDSTAREVRLLREQMLLDQFMDLDVETRTEILLAGAERLDLPTLLAIQRAPEWLRRRVGPPEMLEKVEEAILVARNPETGSDYLATKCELEQLRSEVEMVATSIKDAAGVDALSAAAGI